jgi:hypothetical protein
MKPLCPVRTRSTASLASPGMIRTRWNASLPGLANGKHFWRAQICRP